MSSQQGPGPRHAAVQRVAGMGFDGASDRPGGPGGSSHRGSQRGSISGIQSGGSQAGGSQAGSPSRSRAGSNAGGSQAGGSQAGSAAGPGPFHKGTGKDPAFDPNDPRPSRPTISDTELVGKRVDLPPEAFRSETGGTRFAVRPGMNTEGKPIQVYLNCFPVTAVPNADIYQYDINVTPNPKDSRALVKKVWMSNAVQTWLAKTGAKWLFDGSKLAWSNKPIPRNEHRQAVDLDTEAGKPQTGRQGIYYVQIRQSSTVRMAYLQKYLEKKADWDNHVLECMNFLDHLMRQWPSEQMMTIKRNFYPRDGVEMQLDPMVGVRKGVYSAFRLGDTTSGSISRGLVLNVDVANTAFWIQEQTLARVAQWLLSPHHSRNWEASMPFGKVADLLRPVETKDKSGNLDYVQSEGFKKIKRIERLRIHITHRGKEQNPRAYKVKRVIFDKKYGQKGGDSYNVTFAAKNKKTGEFAAPISIYDYWKKKYGRLGYPDLPIIETERDGLFPMEVCKLDNFQRYAYKLDPEQTSAMIKIAVSRPNIRKTEIMKGVGQLKWNQDPYFREYGIKVNSEMLLSNARLLKNPEIHFGGGAKLNPGMAGRWDLRGKKFIEPNPRPLVSWGFIGCGANDGQAVEKAALSAFASNFCRIYKGHGGIIGKDPFVEVYPFSVTYPEMCTKAYNDTGNFCKNRPQIIFFVTGTRNQLVYERLKKNMDCRICLISQNMLADHVRRNSPQYCSNVAMKVNAKLGGSTCKATPIGQKPNFMYFQVPTMVLGLDVTHGAPASGQPSIAALTMSIDKSAMRYCSNVQTNGWRTEGVTDATMLSLFDRLMKYWVKTFGGCAPKHVYYFRDGVAEGQFNYVLEHEVKTLRRIFRDAGHEAPRFTAIVATKRHHIRFFPKANDASAADKNNNPLPGTLVEHDATHPFHWDFYLASHVAIQGTARPVHYHVILDEANCNADRLQSMIYHQCYQYMRSTTPVSIHPAIYYSHLAAARAVAHQDIASSNREVPSGKAGFPLGKSGSVYSGAKPLTEAPALLPMSNQGANADQVAHLNTTMWYI
ncbi:hypothetical protein JX266_003369 [Neoarthrinium moseri]|uniref:uncharacterized protein n=1 Tax=Neoarthrinium moseri TaxID=1658444 RepID=UPI001FDDCD85|nr:uncharacterized protein JN550_000723 [Neoarthrinium moseri]KAI1851294.1 hypothetical protein JX266_003369 [Neoarthrinium moseri]KAI1878541.1 hypothetical protein JN550_000723 [Neoarthrinium moseri]